MIYVVGPEGSSVVKIGFTAGKPSERLGGLQIGNPSQLVVQWSGAGDRDMERHLHAVFRDYWVRGEWFDLTPLEDPARAVKEEIRKAVDGLANGQLLLKAERIRHKPQPTRQDLSDVEYLDLENPPGRQRGRVIYMPPQDPFASWDARFPSLEKRPVQQSVGDRDPKPGCIRAWQGTCHRPAKTACDC